MELKELQEISKKNFEFVKDYYLGNSNEFQQMIIIYAHKNQKKINISAVLADSESFKNRFEVLANLGIDLGVRTFLKKEYDSVDAIFSLGEAWMTKYEGKEKIKNEDFEEGKALMPSEDPNHLEVLMSAGLSFDKKMAMDIKIIRKAWNGNGIEVNFEELNMDAKKQDGKKENDIEIESSFLNCFWEAFNLIKGFSEQVKHEVTKQEIKEKTSEELVEIYSKIFYQFLKDKKQI